MSNITRAKAVKIYTRVCDHFNLTRPRFGHYFEYQYGDQTIFGGMVEQGKKEIIAGQTDSHYAQWLTQLIAEAERDWAIIRKLARS